MKQPLAFRMRPETLDEVIGQQHLIGPGQVIRRCIEQGRLFSMIFYGPPGTGKTTLASVLANELHLPYRLFNAVTGNKKELDTIFEEAKFYDGLVLIIDEVHRLNKDKQDLLLPHVENGRIILIGATTSNPTMAINPAIRSRCHLFAIKPLETADIIAALNRAAASEKGLNGQVQLDPKAAELIAGYCGGDIRYALNVLEPVSYTHLDVYKRQHKQTVSLAVEQRGVKNGTIYVDQILRNQNSDRLAGIVFDQHAVTADPFFFLIQLRIRQTAAFNQRLLKKRILTYLFFQMVVAADIDQIRVAAQIGIPHPNELILIINSFQNVDHPVGVVNPCFTDNDRQRFQSLKITVNLLDQRVLQLRRGVVQILNTVLLALGAHIMNITQTAQ